MIKIGEKKQICLENFFSNLKLSKKLEDEYDTTELKFIFIELVIFRITNLLIKKN